MVENLIFSSHLSTTLQALSIPQWQWDPISKAGRCQVENGHNHHHIIVKNFPFSNKHHPHTRNGSDPSVVIPDETTNVLAEDKKFLGKVYPVKLQSKPVSNHNFHKHLTERSLEFSALMSVSKYTEYGIRNKPVYQQMLLLL